MLLGNARVDKRFVVVGAGNDQVDQREKSGAGANVPQ